MRDPLYQRDHDGRPVRDGLRNDRYPDIPAAELFWNAYSYEAPVSIDGWCWRSDYGHWGAVVTFADGWHGVTSTKP